MNFEQLANIITDTHQQLQQSAVKAVNQCQTVRNWLMGFYIVEFEQNGEDRAQYGEQLLKKLEQRINQKGLNVTLFQRSRMFYGIYPQFRVLIEKIFTSSIYATLLPKLESSTEKQIYATLLPKLKKTDSSNNASEIPTEKLISSISFAHFTELMKIDNPVKRMYYEMLTIQTGLSVRELRRQIGALSYERVGLSGNMENALAVIQQKIHPQTITDAVKDDYFFEFLNIPQQRASLLIGDEFYFIDMVFYHRILKCHVLCELKVDTFNHAHVSQLYSYLNYYKAEVMEADDNPPIGILLVTDKNDALVQYTTAGLDEQIFVSKYQLQLPTEQQLKELILKTLRQ